MFKCNKCNKTFKSLRALGGHQRAHSPKTSLGNDIIKSRERAFQKKINNEQTYNLTPIFCAQCDSKIPYDAAKQRKYDIKNKNIKNCFCSHSCAATYNNTHKKTGTRRSKLELYLEKQLTETFTDLEIHFNKKDTINSELDIFIPDLQLAFELNGIYHYEPIHGNLLLEKIQNNDNRKFQACLEKNIELCIIDTSSLGYFKEINAKPFLTIIIGIIQNKLSRKDLNLQPKS